MIKRRNHLQRAGKVMMYFEMRLGESRRDGNRTTQSGSHSREVKLTVKEDTEATTSR